MCHAFSTGVYRMLTQPDADVPSGGGDAGSLVPHGSSPGGGIHACDAYGDCSVGKCAS